MSAFLYDGILLQGEKFILFCNIMKQQQQMAWGMEVVRERACEIGKLRTNEN